MLNQGGAALSLDCRGATAARRLDCEGDKAAMDFLKGTGMGITESVITYKGGDGREKTMTVKCVTNVNPLGQASGRKMKDAANLTAGRQRHYNKEFKTALETNSRLRHKWALKKVKAIGEGDAAAWRELVASVGREEAEEMCEKYGVSTDEDGLGADVKAKGGAGW